MGPSPSGLCIGKICFRFYLRENFTYVFIKNKIWKTREPEKKKKEIQVRLYRTGYPPLPIHRRDPTTAGHGRFCLLRFRPGPIPSSLDNLGTLGSPEVAILMPSLARTPDRHSATTDRDPDLKPSSAPCLQAAGLQEHATTPSERTGRFLELWIFYLRDFIILFVFSNAGGGLYGSQQDDVYSLGNKPQKEKEKIGVSAFRVEPNPSILPHVYKNLNCRGNPKMTSRSGGIAESIFDSSVRPRRN